MMPRTLLRLPDWQRRLTDLLIREQATPFCWGTADCATLAFAAVRAVTGTDLAHDVPAWSSAMSAARALRIVGCENAASYFAKHLPEIPPAFAHRGDLVLPAGDVGVIACPAILTGADAMSRDERGWVVMPRALVGRAFKVGE